MDSARLIRIEVRLLHDSTLYAGTETCKQLGILVPGLSMQLIFQQRI